MDTVCVVGLWHLGIVNAVGFCERGYRVIGLEFDRKRLRKLQRGIPPLFEPGLRELLARHRRSKRLKFSAAPADVRQATYVVIAYDSPVNERDAVDVTPVVHAVQSLAPFLRPETLVVITSQVPLGTSERLEAAIAKRNRRWRMGVVYTPENLKLGGAIARFLKPDMLVLGANRPEAARAARVLYRPFHTKKLSMDLRSAEMVKHALNAFLATSISFSNEIAQLADRLGADAVRVGEALRLDTRIGRRALLTPGLGFSGGTLARDVAQLQKFAREHRYRAPLLEGVRVVNDETFRHVVSVVRHALRRLPGKNIGILGLTYKPGTSTLRRSPAIALMKKLTAAGARLRGYDPMADHSEVHAYRRLFRRVASVAALARGADALVLVTEWPEFRRLPYAVLGRSMRQPIMVDTKNFLDPEILTAAGFRYIGFGRQQGVAPT